MEFDPLRQEGFDFLREIGRVFDRAEDPQFDPRPARCLDRLGQSLVGHDAPHPCEVILRFALGHPAVGIDAVGHDIEFGAAAIRPQRPLVVRSHREADLRFLAGRDDCIEHGPKWGDMLRRHAGYPGACAPLDDLWEQRIVVNHVIAARADFQQDAFEGVALVGSELAGAAVDPPWQDFVIGCLADRNEALVMRSVGSVKIDFVPCGAQATAKHVAVRLHSAPEGFGDGMADMGEDRDLHVRSDALCDMIEKRPRTRLFPKANINGTCHRNASHRIAFFSQEDR